MHTTLALAATKTRWVSMLQAPKKRAGYVDPALFGSEGSTTGRLSRQVARLGLLGGQAIRLETAKRDVLPAIVRCDQHDERQSSAGKDSPDPRSVEPPKLGEVIELPLLGGLHHRYTGRAA